MKRSYATPYAGLLLTVVALGCGGEKSQPVTRATATGTPVPSQIELLDAKAKFEDPDIIQVEVNYRFTSGGPTNHYKLEVEFPGTDNHGVKDMAGWELQESGVIRDGFVLQSLPVGPFTVRVTEALLPQDGYSPISNELTGETDMTGYSPDAEDSGAE